MGLPATAMPLLPRTSPTAQPFTLWRWLWEEERVGIPLCVGVAVFLTLVFRGGFVDNLIYSLCIGQTIQFSIEAGRFAAARWLSRSTGHAFDCDHGWPGWAFMAPWIVLCSLGGYWLGMHLGDWLTGKEHAAALRRGNLAILLPVGMVTLTVSIGTTWFYYVRGRLAEAQASAEAAQRLAAENQLRLLQSQLEPHMLFNTLANLRVLIGLDAARAQAMLDQLVGFLRSTLQASRQSAHPLGDEFSRLADYLALMQVRMGQRLHVEMDLPAGLEAVPVPPLLLQPLVENAINHGLEPKRDGGRIALRAERDGTMLRLSVRDTGLGLADASHPGGTPGAGFGVEQVRARLAMLYGGDASLVLQPADDALGGTLAVVTLPLRTS